MTDSKETPLRLPVREMRDEPAPQRAAQEGDLPPLPEPDYPAGTTGMLGESTYTADQMREYARLALAAAGGGVPHDALIQARDMLESWSSYVPPYFAEKHGLKDDFATLDKWIASSPQPEAAPAVAQVPQCRSDGRCQYAIDHGAEGLGCCPAGKCAYAIATEAPPDGRETNACTYPDCTGKQPPDGDCCKTPDMTQVPDGWKLVPVEPGAKALTLMAGAILYQPFMTADNRHPYWKHAVEQAEAAYRVLIAAATEAPAQAAQSAGEVERDHKDAER